MRHLKPVVEADSMDCRLVGATYIHDTRNRFEGNSMRAWVLPFVASLRLLAVPAGSSAQSFKFPPAFAVRDIATNGATIHVRSGGNGPAVVLLHGYGETGDMWVPMAAELARDHTVIV